MNSQSLLNVEIRDTIHKTVFEILKTSFSEQNIKRFATKHQSKIHFVPLRYRIIGGILQSLNIKFGNFIEQLIGNIIEVDHGVETMPDSGKKIRLYFTPGTGRGGRVCLDS